MAVMIFVPGRLLGVGVMLQAMVLVVNQSMVACLKVSCCHSCHFCCCDLDHFWLT